MSFASTVETGRAVVGVDGDVAPVDFDAPIARGVGDDSPDSSSSDEWNSTYARRSGWQAAWAAQWADPYAGGRPVYAVAVATDPDEAAPRGVWGEPVGDGWELCYTSEGHPFYYRASDGVSQWELPSLSTADDGGSSGSSSCSSTGDAAPISAGASTSPVGDEDHPLPDVPRAVASPPLRERDASDGGGERPTAFAKPIATPPKLAQARPPAGGAAEEISDITVAVPPTAAGHSGEAASIFALTGVTPPRTPPRRAANRPPYAEKTAASDDEWERQTDEEEAALRKRVLESAQLRQRATLESSPEQPSTPPRARAEAASAGSADAGPRGSPASPWTLSKFHDCRSPPPGVGSAGKDSPSVLRHLLAARSPQRGGDDSATGAGNDDGVGGGGGDVGKDHRDAAMTVAGRLLFGPSAAATPPPPPPALSPAAVRRVRFSAVVSVWGPGVDGTAGVPTVENVATRSRTSLRRVRRLSETQKAALYDVRPDLSPEERPVLPPRRSSSSRGERDDDAEWDDGEGAWSRGQTLHQLAADGRVASVRALLSAGAAVDARDGVTGATPLMLACDYGRLGVVAALLEAGADPTQQMKELPEVSSPMAANGDDTSGDGGSPSFHASLSEPVPRPAPARVHLSPVHVAAARGDIALLQVLVEAGADPGAKDARRRSPMHAACALGHAHAANWLYLAGADDSLGGPDERGRTPLHYAAAAGRADCVRFLLECAAPARALDGQGRSAAQMADGNGHAAVAAMIREYC